MAHAGIAIASELKLAKIEEVVGMINNLIKHDEPINGVVFMLQHAGSFQKFLDVAQRVVEAT